MYSCNLPPALLAELPGPFTELLLRKHGGGTGTEIRVGTEGSPWRRILSRRSCQDPNPRLRTFDHESGTLCPATTPPPPPPVPSPPSRAGMDSLRYFFEHNYVGGGRGWEGGTPQRHLTIIVLMLQYGSYIMIFISGEKQTNKQANKQKYHVSAIHRIFFSDRR